MKTLFFALFTLFLTVPAVANNAAINDLPSGDWYFKLKISNDCYIPVYGSIKNNILTITNGAESITLEPFSDVNSSLVAKFSLYHSSVIITSTSKKTLSGYWRNYNRKGDYKIHFTAFKKIPKRKKNKKILQHLNGKWETSIMFGKATKLVGEFKHINNELHGTFRSETGDYRFLAGHAIKDSLFLSCFDGTHCYLFTGRLHGTDSISGHFYSGNHYKTIWTAKKNPYVILRDPDSLTYIANQNPIHFVLPSTDDKMLCYDTIRSNAKPTIIQIFGSWCPNCVDETNYLNEINKVYGEHINIVGVGFEMGGNETIKMQHLKSFKTKMNVHYPMLLGGSADKKEAAKIFPMLNHVMSFPTLLVVNHDGKVVKIHTGFNGPATGDHYTNFKTEMSSLLNDLVSI